MNNPIAGQGAVGQAPEMAQAALSRRVPTRHAARARLPRAVGLHKDFAQRTERERQRTRAEAYARSWPRRYRPAAGADLLRGVSAATQSLNDKTYGPTLKAAGILEQQFKKYPRHPGAHYLIPGDYPPIAQKGVNAARLREDRAGRAARAAHALAHLHARGRWEDAVQTNPRSASAARKGNEGDESWHAVDYMVYAYLQMGRDRQAGRPPERAEIRQHLAALRRALCHPAAIPARLAIERGDWKAASALELPRPSSRSST